LDARRGELLELEHREGRHVAERVAALEVVGDAVDAEQLRVVIVEDVIAVLQHRWEQATRSV
jgi:hypothetical protein